MGDGVVVSPSHHPQLQARRTMPKTIKLVCNQCGHESFTGFDKRYQTCEKCKSGRYYAINECFICKKQFKANRRIQEVCSRECRQIWSKDYLKRVRIKKCVYCGKKFEARGEYSDRKQTYCSPECFKKDENSYSKIRRDYNVDFDNKYKNIHKRITKKLGKPQVCWQCGRKATSKCTMDWANIDHKYTENPNDWVRLCSRCHVRYDKGEIKLTLKFKIIIH